ncbi:hypothetical protein [Bowmanella denitrificans]|uniref:hypothetical protein n=1 Tax=Bowmanella denitrificans TaxID=366582 RepID=UPI0011AFC479|nr:hypothetical protein [Bowmanella denitrificans]
MFKYLYMVMLAVLVFRTAVMVLHEGWSFLKIGNVLLGVGIATVGMAFVSALIAVYAVIQDSKTNKAIKSDS